MKKINDNIKKWLVVAGGLVICAVLVAMISSRFQKEPLEDMVLPNEKTEVGNIIIEKPNDKGKEGTKENDDKIEDVNSKDNEDKIEKEEGIKVPPIKVPDTQVTNKNGVDKGTKQTIQKDAEKPKEPRKEELTDPTQKPNGEKVVEPPKNVDHDKVEKPIEPPKKKDEPKGGDTNNKGQTYLPGFGWIENSGENQGSKAEDMYENGNKVGNMD